MTSVTDTTMPLKAIAITHRDDEGDQRLIIEEGDRNNNEKLQWLTSAKTIRPLTPNGVANVSVPLKIKTENQLETNTKRNMNSVVSGSKDSHLRRALEKRPRNDVSHSYPVLLDPKTIPSSLSSTPLLAASLSRPPVAKPSSSLATLASAAVAASATPCTVTIIGNVVDLSLRNNKQKQAYSLDTVKRNNYEDGRTYSKIKETSVPIKHNCKTSVHSPSDVYANLLMQLRNAQARMNNGSRSLSPLAVVQQIQDHMTHDSAPNLPSMSANATNSKMTSAAARKEKLRLQPSFQCPVCKKRFQRHIAMNAHFQNEHIDSTDTEKVCKLCSHTCYDIAAIRAHLRLMHSIDLDSPAACLADGESLTNECYNVVKTASASCPSSPSSSSSPQETIQSVDSAEACHKPKKSNKGKSNQHKSSYNKIKYQENSNPANVHSSLRSSPKWEASLEDLPGTSNYDESSSSSSVSNISSSPLNTVDAITSSSIQKCNTYLVKGNASAIEDGKDSSKCIKQEPIDDSSSFNNLQSENYDEATDLTVKKVPKEMQSPSNLKRRAIPYNSSVTSNNLLMFADVGSSSISKRIKNNNRTLEGSQVPHRLKNSPNKSEDTKLTDVVEENVFQFKCQHCSILFPNHTLYFLHKGFHSEGSNPWRCNGCGRYCSDMYDFNTHLMSDSHN